jgi:HYR domain-containing protein
MNNVASGTRVLISLMIVVAWVALASITGARRVSALTFTVMNLGDNGGVNPAANAGTGTLRQAIIDANANAGADMISFQAGLTGTITLANDLPQVTQDVTINGPGANVMAVSGNTQHRVFQISGVTVSISGLTISRGNSGAGGGILNDGGTLTVTNCTFSNNQAFLSGGGGIFNNGISASAKLTVTNCTFSGNSSNTGGGIQNNAGTVTVTNSTFSGNFGFTGGIANTPGATLAVSNSTFSGNSAFGGGAGGISNFASATVKNSIIANSSGGGNCGGSSAITGVGVNYSTDNTCGAGFSMVPSTGAGGLNLGSLQNNGGPTFTIALQPGSVAIDKVMDCTDLSAMPASVTTDQRGKPRPADGDGSGSALCDAGAFEVQPCTLTCHQAITQGNDSNQCGAFVTFADPTTSGDCFTVTCTPASGSFFPVGMTTVNCDSSATSANPDCSFTVMVNDTQPPSITCPNITQSTDPNKCSAVVNYSNPSGFDNCQVATVLCSPPSGATFQKGTTTVNCTATDTSNNTASCSFTVTVNDTQPPSIACPANITVTTASNLCSATVSYSAPMVSDNCPGVGAPACSPPSGSTFPTGTTTVTCTVTDAAINTASCMFNVTVNDTQAPVITCPTTVTAVSAAACPPTTSTVVTFPTPTASDNCPGVTVACSPPSGSTLPAGTTTVTCTATDASGNTAACSFTVTVFNGRLQDDSNPKNVLLFNTTTGDYRLCCGGTLYTGKGIAVLKGCVFTLQNDLADRRMLVNVDFSLKRGTASLQSPPGVIKCTITDRNMMDDTGTCP